jgi:hypothetical protein
MLMIISLASLISSSLSVLRVLTRQILQISTKVKDSSFPGPSLEKVVKDSTLTILPRLESFHPSIGKEGTSLEGFCRERVHCLRERGLIWI